MHAHDPDLIMALAAGELDAATAAAAEAQIADCAPCSRDLDLQRSAIAALADTPRVYLSAAESARLHSTVRDELGLETSVDRPERRRRFSVGALAGAAAVLLAIVLAAPALDLLGADDGDRAPAADEALAPAPPPRSENEAEPILPARPQAPTEPTSTASAEAGRSLPAPAGPGLQTFASDIDLEELRSRVVESGGPEQFLSDTAEDQAMFAPEAATTEASPEEDVPSPASDFGEDGAAIPSFDCNLHAVPGVPSGATPTILGFVEFADVASLVVAYVDSPDDARLVVLSLDSCEVLASA